MSKKTLRIITILATIIACVGATAVCWAVSTPTQMTPEGESTEVINVGKRIMSVLQAVGVVVAVLILMVLGIKYMMGSAEEKAEYKKTFIPYIIGAVLVFAASTLANVVYNFATTIKGSGA